jgi:predicted phosphodiesterase
MKSFKSYVLENSELTLQYHMELNPDLWDHQTLKSEVKDKLVQIADIWTKFANISSDAIEDLLLVGGNANFNYTPYSDIDLHILVDKSKIADCPEILDDYLKDKKYIWSQTHDIKIYGHDVEVYAQDIKETTPVNQGSYSILRDEWITAPKQEEVDLNSPELKLKIQNHIHKIESLLASNASDESFEKLKEKIKNMRSSGLKKAGEFSLENLTFKELRNLGYFDKINNYIKTKQDEKLSLSKTK